jgi:hypothetical protein
MHVALQSTVLHFDPSLSHLCNRFVTAAVTQIVHFLAADIAN